MHDEITNREKFPKNITISWLKFMYSKNLITPYDIVEEIIIRSQEDEDYNIWITKPTMSNVKRYLNDLENMDRSLPLWGIPFAIKDNINLNGIATTAGCKEYSYVPKENAVIVERLIKAGAIPLGKTNLDQFATGLVGTRSPYGEVHNSKDEKMISGGSSSGSAVAVARGQAAFSLGTDTAGSGRVPAALNNLVGLKPSLGAWPVKGLVPACESLDCITVFANNLDDVNIVDDVARGICHEDKWSKDIKKDYSQIPKKICLPKNELTFYGDYAEDYRKAWESFLSKIKSLDIEFEYIDISIFEKAAQLLYGGPWISERWSSLGEFVKEHSEAIFETTRKVLESGAGSEYSASDMFDAMHELQEYKKLTKKILEGRALIMPTCGGTFSIAQVNENSIETNSQMGLYTNHCNLLNLCAIAIPASYANEKLPFGVTVFGLHNNEALISNTAKKISKLQSEKIEIAVCGLHMRGFQLEKQMNECFAEFVREDKTASKYKLIKFADKVEKPGLIKVNNGGASIDIEIWSVPNEMIGKFVQNVHHPLAIGEIELQDGSNIYGFVCEGYAAEFSEDITKEGGWKNYKRAQ